VYHNLEEGEKQSIISRNHQIHKQGTLKTILLFSFNKIAAKKMVQKMEYLMVHGAPSIAPSLKCTMICQL
jgi:hypothetical protein